MKHIFIISGKKGVGKDTVGRLIANHIEHSRTFSFATPFKKFCIDVLGIPHEWCFGDSSLRNNEIDIEWNEIAFELGGNKTGRLTVRDALILIGQHMRKMYPNIWANAAKVEARKFFSENPKNNAFILTDTRQPNEIDVFLNSEEVKNGLWNVVTIRVWREVPFDKNSHDYTEVALDHLDFVPAQQNINQMGRIPYGFFLEESGNLLVSKGYGANYYINNNIDKDALTKIVTRILGDFNVCTR